VSILGRFVGKVPAIYGITLILVFLTFLLAKIVGESGVVFFEITYALLIVELIIPLATMLISVSFFLNILMPTIILPVFEFLTNILIGAINLGVTAINIPLDFLGEPMTMIQNPFAGVSATWVPIDMYAPVTLLLDIFDRLKAVLDAI